MGKAAFLFPGQGAQAVGMGQESFKDCLAARELFDRANTVLGYDLSDICFHGPTEKLDTTVFSQPALFVSSLAAIERMKIESREVVSSAEFTAGLSLGEYTALTFAGVMEFEDALGVVKCRGESMQAAADETRSGMVSILGLELSQVEELCDTARLDGQVLQVANHLCPGNIVVSGSTESCEAIIGHANEAGAMKVIPLAVAGAFHTPLMDSAVNKLAAVVENVPMRAPRIPVVSNVDAATHDSPDEIRRLLVQQVVQPVRWEDSMRYLLDRGVDKFFEVGSGRVLRGLLRRIDRKIDCTNIS